MRRLRRSLIVPTLTILWLIFALACPATAQGQEEATSVVPNSLLRAATARIDSLELRLRLELNRAVERDSLDASRTRWWEAQVLRAEQRAVYWEQSARSWWTRHESAFWAVLGAVAVALAARL